MAWFCQATDIVASDPNPSKFEVVCDANHMSKSAPFHRYHVYPWHVRHFFQNYVDVPDLELKIVYFGVELCKRYVLSSQTLKNFGLSLLTSIGALKRFA